MNKKTSRLLICILLCISVLFAFASVAINEEHDCIGEECHICVEIQQCKTLLRNLSGAVALAAFALCLPLGIVHVLENIDRRISFPTPITLKVKLLN